MDIIERGTIAITPGDVPDYSAPKPLGAVPIGPVYTSTDIAELAARLGSIVTYDRRGNVADLDNFEAPVLNWTASGAPAGYEISLSSDKVKSGSQCVKLSLTAGVGNMAWISRRRSVLAAKVLGIEFSIGSISTVYTITLDFYFEDGEHKFLAEVKIDPLGRKIYIHDGDLLDWREIVAIGQVKTGPFYGLKLVCDFDKAKYRRLLFSDMEYDISQYSIEKRVSPTAPCVTSAIFITGTSAIGGGLIYIDSYILTQNEPPNI